jgi:mutual gliding-motility protein MglA
MAFINITYREFPLSIVYWGPGLAGKSTALRRIHQLLAPAARTELRRTAGGNGSLLTFDMLLPDLRVKGLPIRLSLTTLPGMVDDTPLQVQMLKGIDGVLFVADSAETRMEENSDSLEALGECLYLAGGRRDEAPLVFQYNKRDLPDAAPTDELDLLLNPHHRPHFGSVASQGEGLLAPLKECLRRSIATRLAEALGGGG